MLIFILLGGCAQNIEPPVVLTAPKTPSTQTTKNAALVVAVKEMITDRCIRILSQNVPAPEGGKRLRHLPSPTISFRYGEKRYYLQHADATKGYLNVFIVAGAERRQFSDIDGDGIVDFGQNDTEDSRTFFSKALNENVIGEEYATYWQNELDIALLLAMVYRQEVMTGDCKTMNAQVIPSKS